MNVIEAKAIVKRLLVYKGKVKIPFLAPVKDLMIVPRGQKEFDAMFKDIFEHDTSFDAALQPYENDVTILVYFEFAATEEGIKHCSYKHFLDGSNPV